MGNPRGEQRNAAMDKQGYAGIEHRIRMLMSRVGDGVGHLFDRATFPGIRLLIWGVTFGGHSARFRPEFLGFAAIQSVLSCSDNINYGTFLQFSCDFNYLQFRLM